MAKTILEQYFNRRLEVNLELKAVDLANEEIARIQTQATQILVALEIPRRVGEAEQQELARDKQMCRRTLHVLHQQLRSWSERDESRVSWRSPTKEDQIAGAQLLWPQWWKNHKKYLEQRRQYYATWGLKKGDKRFSNQAVNRLTQELYFMEHAMR